MANVPAGVDPVTYIPPTSVATAQKPSTAPSATVPATPPAPVTPPSTIQSGINDATAKATAIQTGINNLPKPTTPPSPAPTSPATPAVAPTVAPGGSFDQQGNYTPPAANPSTPSTSTINGVIQGAAPDGALQSANGNYVDASGNQYALAPGTPVSTPGASNAQQLADTQAAYQKEAANVASTITNIQNGTIPLNAGEQAQVSALQQQFEQLIGQQQLQNTGATGTAQLRGYQTGSAEYDPAFQVKTIGSIVTAGINKVTDLATKEASAVAALTQSLKDNDIQKVKDAYAIYQDASKARQAALQQSISDATQAIKDAQAEADKQQQYNLDVAKFKQTGDQNAFDNALKTEQQAFDEKNKTATLALDQFKAGMGAGGGSNGVTTAAKVTPSGAPDPASQQQVLAQITQKYGPMTAQAIQGLANYSINPSDWSSRAGTKGLSRADAVSLAQMYDPTYSDTNYAIRASYLKSLSSTQSGTVGSAVNAANKSINHLTAYVTDMGKLGSTGSSLLNAGLLNTVGQLIPGERQTLSAAKTEGLGVAEELAKFFKGTGTVDVASIDAWKSQLSTNASPADVKGLTQGAITLLSGQLETLAEQYQSTMGKAPETDFLNPSARASLSSLKNQGFDVNIPGINYTDKNAYLKADPNAQANMTAAVTALTNAGLPITPENILQAAQSM